MSSVWVGRPFVNRYEDEHMTSLDLYKKTFTEHNALVSEYNFN